MGGGGLGSWLFSLEESARALAASLPGMSEWPRHHFRRISVSAGAREIKWRSLRNRDCPGLGTLGVRAQPRTAFLSDSIRTLVVIPLAIRLRLNSSQRRRPTALHSKFVARLELQRKAFLEFCLSSVVAAAQRPFSG